MKRPHQLIEVFEDLFGESIKELSKEELSIDTVHNWDSLNHLRLMMAVEDVYKVELSPDDFQKLTTYSELEKFLEE
jgi:acyl carrier protein